MEGSTKDNLNGAKETTPADVPNEEMGGEKQQPKTEEPVDDSIDPENEIKGIKLVIIHTALCLGVFLSALDMNVIATAIPNITTQFNSIGDVGWYGSAFFLGLKSRSAIQPIAGKLYMLFPKKLVYLSYLFVFEVGSLICALAPSSEALIAGRAIAGLGASGVFGGGMIILATVIPLKKRAIWQGTMNCVYGVASIIGPPIGGALTQNVSWRWVFYINLPIGGFAAVLIALFFRVKRADTENAPLLGKIRGLDGVGAVLFAASIAMLILALQWGGVTHPWRSSTIIGLFIGCGVTFATFIPWQIYLKDDALIPTKLFKHRNLSLLCIDAFFMVGPFQTVVYWLPVWFQAVLGVSPTQSAVRYLPTVIADVVTSFAGMGLVMKIGWWTPFKLFGNVLISIGAGLLTTLYPGISDGHWIGYQILGGVGYAFALNLIHLGYQASTPKQLIPIAASTSLTVIAASGAVFLAIGQTIFQQRLTGNLRGVVSPDIADSVSSAGASTIRSVVEAEGAPGILTAYSDSVVAVFYLSTSATVIAFLVSCGCKWTSLKQNNTTPAVEEKKESVKPHETPVEAQTKQMKEEERCMSWQEQMGPPV